MAPRGTAGAPGAPRGGRRPQRGRRRGRGAPARAAGGARDGGGSRGRCGGSLAPAARLALLRRAAQRARDRPAVHDLVAALERALPLLPRDPLPTDWARPPAECDERVRREQERCARRVADGRDVGLLWPPHGRKDPRLAVENRPPFLASVAPASTWLTTRALPNDLGELHIVSSGLLESDTPGNGGLRLWHRSVWKSTAEIASTAWAARETRFSHRQYADKAAATKEATEAKSAEPETKGAEPAATVRRASAPRVALPRKL